MFCSLILDKAAIGVILHITKPYIHQFCLLSPCDLLAKFLPRWLRWETGTELTEQHKFFRMQLKKLGKNSHPPPPIHHSSLTLTFFIGREVFGVRHGSSSLRHLGRRINKGRSSQTALTTPSLQGRNSEEGWLVSVQHKGKQQTLYIHRHKFHNLHSAPAAAITWQTQGFKGLRWTMWVKTPQSEVGRLGKQRCSAQLFKLSVLEEEKGFLIPYNQQILTCSAAAFPSGSPFRLP